jgi:hypothetical protein
VSEEAVSILSRIAQLHRELAEAYEQLAAEEREAAPVRAHRKRPIVPVAERPAQSTIDSVRRSLRRAGVQA